MRKSTSKVMNLCNRVAASAVTPPRWPFTVLSISPEVMLLVKITPFFAPEARYKSSRRARESTGLLWLLTVKISSPQ